jgi:hypothetical protein
MADDEDRMSSSSEDSGVDVGDMFGNVRDWEERGKRRRENQRSSETTIGSLAEKSQAKVLAELKTSLLLGMHEQTKLEDMV